VNLPKIGRVYRNQQTDKLYKILEVGYDPNVAPDDENPAVGRVVIYTRYGSNGKKLFIRSIEDFFARVEKGGDGEEAGREVQRFIQVVPKTFRSVETQYGVLKVPESWRIARKNRALGVAVASEDVGTDGESIESDTSESETEA